MDPKELKEINSIMKKVFIWSFVVYSAFSLFVFTALGHVLSPMQKFLVITFAPLAIGLVVLGVYKKKTVRIDESPMEEIIDEETADSNTDEE